MDELQPYLDASLLEHMRLPVDPTVRVSGIARQLTALLNAPLQQLTPQLRKIAAEHYDWKLKAAQMVEAYQAAVDSMSKPPQQLYTRQGKDAEAAAAQARLNFAQAHADVPIHASSYCRGEKLCDH